MNNISKNEVGMRSWDEKSQLHNFPLKPVNTEVVQFLLKLGLFKFVKLCSSQILQSFIEVGTTSKKWSKKLKLGYACQLAVELALSLFLKLWDCNPPYKYGGMKPPILFYGVYQIAFEILLTNQTKK